MTTNGTNRTNRSPESLAAYIDHTALKPETSRDDIVRLCEEAMQYRFATVCVNPYWVKTAAGLLDGSGVGITTVIGFPLGATSTFAKAAEARDAIASGATEIDMVLNVGALKSGLYEEVERDIARVAEACEGEAVLKVILETGLLSDEEKVKACELCVAAGADFVKTSTGFGPGGATADDIALMRRTVGPDVGVKASGGVRDAKTARAMIAAGATRIGASASIAIVTGGTGEGY
ncbi:deoxyribose-phosphate aldolase [Cohnella ginsengisoli]|uniref:Deoxyribose-phosphate aldolase n=1 Tax=Cohnella ginsengisoli TaxID=425004 RepID=A0A9X4KEW8_9BACL|nr:deoxyribose-phosphate aldolase [Cohnella ginsengisoli]MDG0790889.1 deoxyribose-phosphate aldolase [Cohnella ginsengisoli]